MISTIPQYKSCICINIDFRKHYQQVPEIFDGPFFWIHFVHWSKKKNEIVLNPIWIVFTISPIITKHKQFHFKYVYSNRIIIYVGRSYRVYGICYEKRTQLIIRWVKTFEQFFLVNRGSFVYDICRGVWKYSYHFILHKVSSNRTYTNRQTILKHTHTHAHIWMSGITL